MLTPKRPPGWELGDKVSRLVDVPNLDYSTFEPSDLAIAYHRKVYCPCCGSVAHGIFIPNQRDKCTHIQDQLDVFASNEPTCWDGSVTVGTVQILCTACGWDYTQLAGNYNHREREIRQGVHFILGHG